MTPLGSTIVATVASDRTQPLWSRGPTTRPQRYSSDLRHPGRNSDYRVCDRGPCTPRPPPYCRAEQTTASASIPTQLRGSPPGPERAVRGAPRVTPPPAGIGVLGSTGRRGTRAGRLRERLQRDRGVGEVTVPQQAAGADLPAGRATVRTRSIFRAQRPVVRPVICGSFDTVPAEGPRKGSTGRHLHSSDHDVSGRVPDMPGNAKRAGQFAGRGVQRSPSDPSCSGTEGAACSRSRAPPSRRRGGRDPGSDQGFQAE